MSNPEVWKAITRIAMSTRLGSARHSTFGRSGRKTLEVFGFFFLSRNFFLSTNWSM
jgi:hypothetical protein